MTTRTERFWRHVRQGEGCWEWIGAISTNGYGRFGQGYAHRFSWELKHGPLPSRRTSNASIDHVCRNRRCVNPAHMELISQRDNIRRGLKGALLTHCKHGHDYAVYGRARATNGARFCIECRRAYDRNRRKSA